jgi:hypothetical protein
MAKDTIVTFENTHLVVLSRTSRRSRPCRFPSVASTCRNDSWDGSDKGLSAPSNSGASRTHLVFQLLQCQGNGAELWKISRFGDRSDLAHNDDRVRAGARFQG